MMTLFLWLLLSHILSFGCGIAITILIEKKQKNRTLNELRQVKDSSYTNPDSYCSNGVVFLCSIYPNDADLGAVIRKTFSKHVERE